MKHYDAVWILNQTVDTDSGSSPFRSTAAFATELAAFASAFETIAEYADDWSDYDTDTVWKFRNALIAEDFNAAIAIWNGMASLQIEIEVNSVHTEEEFPEIDFSFLDDSLTLD